MPEISEVRQTVDLLQTYVGSQLLRWDVITGFGCALERDPEYAEFASDLPLILDSVQSKGKFIYFAFRKADVQVPRWYGLHSMMLTGRWQETMEPGRLRWHLLFMDPTPRHLYFTDSRGFATLQLTGDADLLLRKLNSLGPDVVRELTLHLFTRLLQTHPRMRISSFLCDQKILSGIGNILRAEILYEAGIDPSRLVKSLDPLEVSNLYQSVHKRILEMYQEGNYPQQRRATFHIYQNPQASKYRPSDGRTLYWDPQRQK